jgi:hypothetical protein
MPKKYIDGVKVELYADSAAGQLHALAKRRE